MNNFSKEVAVIILNYNSSDFTLACVKSLTEFTSSDLSFEIIVVDNASKTEDWQNLQRLNEHKSVKLFRSKINLGFSGGNMLGVQFANAKYLCFLNNDCTFHSDCLTELYHFLEKMPEAAACTAQMFSGTQERLSSFSYFPTATQRLLGNSVLRYFYPEEFPSQHLSYRQPVEVQVIAGAFMFVRASSFSEVGGMDVTHFLYCEEEDLCFKLRKKGYKIYLVPTVEYTHWVGGSTKRSYEIERELYISLFWFFRKHYSFGHLKVLQMIYFWKNIRKFYRDKKFSKLALFILKGCPQKESLKFKQEIIFDA